MGRQQDFLISRRCWQTARITSASGSGSDDNLRPVRHATHQAVSDALHPLLPYYLDEYWLYEALFWDSWSTLRDRTGSSSAEQLAEWHWIHGTLFFGAEYPITFDDVCAGLGLDVALARRFITDGVDRPHRVYERFPIQQAILSLTSYLPEFFYGRELFNALKLWGYSNGVISRTIGEMCAKQKLFTVVPGGGGSRRNDLLTANMDASQESLFDWWRRRTVS